MKTTKKVYVGGWSANNGSTCGHWYEGTNKRKLAKEMREIAEGNTFQGSTGRWAVYEIVDGEREEEPVLSGSVKC